MKYQLAIILSMLGMSSLSYSAGPTQFALSRNSSSTTVSSDGKVSIHPGSQKTLKITKDFYGVNANGFVALPQSVLVKPLNLGFLKFGGNFYSVYNWKTNTYVNREKSIETIFLPLENRIDYTQKVYNTVPMFQVNMLGLQPDYNEQGTLSPLATATAEHAAEAIKFLNRDHSLGLQNIIMGNEPFDSFDVHNVAIPSADEYIEKYIKYAMALREAQVAIGGKPEDLKFWGPEISDGWNGWQTTHPNDCKENYDVPGGMVCSYGNGKFSEFIPYFLYRIAEFENNKNLNPKGYKLLDYLTWHYYPLFRQHFIDKDSIITVNGKQNVPGMLESVNLWTASDYINKYDQASPKKIAPQMVNKFKQWRDSYYPNAKLAVTEFGVDSIENVPYHPIVRPLYLADLIARLGEAGVNTFVNSFLQGQTNYDSWGMLNDGYVTPIYHVYSLFSNNYLGTVLSSTDTYGDKVNSYSVKTPTGINIILVNKDMVPHNPTFTLPSQSQNHNLPVVTLPAWSVTVIIVPDHGDNIQVQQYGAKEMGLPISLD
ncbi:MAG: glycoside hydrolase family 44 protein [Pseudobdellovibrionaceae bacterium]